MDPTRPGTAALLVDAARRLRGIGAGNPRLEAEYLLAHALRADRLELLRRRPDEPIDAPAASAFERLLERRLLREPLQYVLGTAIFCDLELEVGAGVLIPRSETEILVEEVVHALTPASATPLCLVDVGTGSGAILLALLQRMSAARGIGIDLSAAALTWARRNARRAALELRVEWREGDLLDGVPPGSASAVTANLPYIRSAELPDLAPEIREFEPVLALDGGADGLDLVRRLLPQAVSVLAVGGVLALELAPDQPAQVAGWLAADPRYAEVRTFRDLAGRERGVLARRR
jgi:release factor glutamine methyltransferase